MASNSDPSELCCHSSPLIEMSLIDLQQKTCKTIYCEISLQFHKDANKTMDNAVNSVNKIELNGQYKFWWINDWMNE